jgi:hypothetical protein
MSTHAGAAASSAAISGNASSPRSAARTDPRGRRTAQPLACVTRTTYAEIQPFLPLISNDVSKGNVLASPL